MNSSRPKAITRSDPTRVEVEWDDGVRTRFTAAELRAKLASALNSARKAQQ